MQGLELLLLAPAATFLIAAAFAVQIPQRLRATLEKLPDRLLASNSHR
jgi:hypothetical protein